MFGVGVPELLIVLLLVVLVFGAKRLPQLGQALGQGISGLRRGLAGRGAEPQAETDERRGESP